MLRHDLAAALLFAIQEQPDVRIGLPTVVKREIELHLVEKVQQSQDRLKRASGQIRQIMGSARQVEECSDDQVKQAFQRRLADLGGLVEVVEPTIEELAEAGRMVLDYMPPSTRNSQQYRDSVIWRIAMRLSADADVYLVTEDEGFYASKKGTDPAESLASEAQAQQRSIKLFRSVGALLTYWGRSIPNLREELRGPVADAVERELAGVLTERSEFAISGRKTVQIEVYLTEDIDQVTVSGRFEFYLADRDSPGGFQSRALAEVRATARVGVASRLVRTVELDRVKIDALTAEGASSISNMVFGRATAHAFGPSTEPYTLSVKFDKIWPDSPGTEGRADHPRSG